MTQLDPKMLLQAALQGSQGGAGIGAAQSAIPAPAPHSQGPPSPPTQPGTAVSGLPDTGGMSNVDLSTLMGQGSELGQQPDTMTQMIQLLQDPSTPPDQKAAIQARLQLGAMAQLAGTPGS